MLALDVPLKPRYSKYLSAKFLSEGKIYLTHRDIEGCYLKTLITARRPGNPIYVKKKYSGRVFTTIYISYFDAVRKVILTDTALTDFERYLDLRLFNEFLTFVYSNSEIGTVKTDEAIRQFKEKYEFTEQDWSFSAMKRAYYRHRNTCNHLIIN